MTWSLLRGLLLVGFLVPLTFIDLDHWLLPFELTIPGLLAGILSAGLLGWEALRDSVLGAAVGFLFFWGLEVLVKAVLRKEGLGAGDKWLVGLLGAFLGWQPLFGLVLLSNVQGAVVGSALLVFRGRAGPAPAGSKPPATAEEDDWSPGPTHLPFGPWLALAGLELVLLGPFFEQLLPQPLARLLTGGLAG